MEPSLTRSDHVRFWYYNERNGTEGMVSQYSFPGVLVSDTAYLRDYMRECYHAKCDDFNHVNKDNMDFLASVTRALAKAVMELCSYQEQLDTKHVDTLDLVPQALGEVTEDEDDEDTQRRAVSHYENVGTQINIQTLHLTLSNTHPLHEAAGKFFYLDPAMATIKKVINDFYDEDGDDNMNSPMVIKLKNDL